MKLDPGQVAIVFTPVVDEQGWTGAIHTGLLFGDDSEKEAMAHSMDIAITMAATERFLEDNPEFLEEYDYYKTLLLEEMFPKQYQASLEELENENKYSKDGNIIRLHRWTKTEGNA